MPYSRLIDVFWSSIILEGGGGGGSLYYISMILVIDKQVLYSGGNPNLPENFMGKVIKNRNF